MRDSFNEINITPLTDIFLVLLIIMMVIAPSFQTMDTDINIPEINSGVTVEQKNAEIAENVRIPLTGREFCCTIWIDLSRVWERIFDK